MGIVALLRGTLSPLDGLVQTVGLSAGSCLSAAVLVLAVGLFGWGSQLPAHASMRFWERYSYGPYVFHRLIAFGLSHAGITAEGLDFGTGSRIPGVLAVGIINGSVSVAIAMASWHLYEQR